MSRSFCSLLLVTTLLAGPFAWGVDDLKGVDLNSMMKELASLQQQQTTQAKANTQKAAQEAAAAAGNTARAVELWEEAVRITQFHGAAKENTAFREWREKEGAAFKEHEVQYALHLYFNWLSITLQRVNGAKVKDLLPAIMAHTREIVADQAMMQAFNGSLQEEKDDAKDGKGKKANPREKEKLRDSASVKKLHDQIVGKGLAGSLYVEWMRLQDVVSEVAPRRGARQAAATGAGSAADEFGEEAEAQQWEGTPGNFDGIYEKIIQPELRIERDPRVVEYIDLRLRREADNASRSKLTFEIDKFNQVRRPQLLWERSREMANIGLKNRAASEMLALIKGNPAYPDLKGWMSELQKLLAPPPPAAPAASPAVAPAPAPPAP